MERTHTDNRSIDDDDDDVCVRRSPVALPTLAFEEVWPLMWLQNKSLFFSLFKTRAEFVWDASCAADCRPPSAVFLWLEPGNTLFLYFVLVLTAVIKETWLTWSPATQFFIAFFLSGVNTSLISGCLSLQQVWFLSFFPLLSPKSPVSFALQTFCLHRNWSKLDILVKDNMHRSSFQEL